MPISNGPTDSGVCAISPSDLVGYTGNLINRVEELEQRIAELEAANVEAQQLSDLAAQAGWIEGVTYMGIEGWTQTPAGTLIPPAGFSLSTNGFTMSDGSVFPAVVMDEDGVLQFGFGGTDADGNLVPIAGSAVPARDILVLGATSDTLNFNDAISWTQLFSNGSSLSVSGETITMPAPGTYAITLQLDAASWDTPPASTGNLNMRINTQADGINLPFLSFTDGGTGTPFLNSITVLVHKSTGDTSSCKIEQRNSAAVITASFTATITKLSSV